MDESHINFQFKAPYYTVNELQEQSTVWLICHGYGQLSKHFSRKFNSLDRQKNYLVFPQGLSKFYLDDKHARVGATWMTKEDRLTDIENQYNYLDAVLNSAVGLNWQEKRINFFGFSQGVSTICRYAAHKKFNFNKLILWGGGIPPELEKEDFNFMSSLMSVHMYLGDKDEYYTEEAYDLHVNKAKEIMGDRVQFTIFDGSHQVVPDLLKDL